MQFKKKFPVNPGGVPLALHRIQDKNTYVKCRRYLVSVPKKANVTGDADTSFVFSLITYDGKTITKKVQNLKYALVLLIAPQMRIAWFEALSPSNHGTIIALLRCRLSYHNYNMTHIFLLLF